MQLKAMVTGANGMLGDALCPFLRQNGYTVYSTDLISNDNIIKLDVRNLKDIMDFVRLKKPDIVFHLAAETDVDKCEIEPEHAYLTNTLGTESVALACQRYDTVMVYISTAGVFDGNKIDPYTEFDVPNPINVYGRTKWEGEKIINNLLRRYFIFRAGWMIGGGKKDKKFVGKIINLLKEKNEISVVNDKFGSPTFTEDMAKCMLNLIKTERYGLYHMTNRGVCSRYDIACEIIKIMGKRDVKINSISSAAFPLPASRSRSEAMLNLKLKLLNMDTMRTWQEALNEYVRKII